MDRVARTLSLLQRGETKIPRGDIQTIFRHSPYDLVHRLGLQNETEAYVRKNLPGETGMLVVDQVIPQGPAHNVFEPGDILIHMNGKLLTNFIGVESLLDSSIGNEITIDLERGGKPISCKLIVQDLDRITPDKFLEVGGGILVTYRAFLCLC